jgi:hypothetical protein
MVGVSNSMDVIVLLAAAVMMIGFLLLVRVEELPLRTMSGLQAQQADAKAASDRAAVAAAQSQDAASGHAAPDGAAPDGAAADATPT